MMSMTSHGEWDDRIPQQVETTWVTIEGELETQDSRGGSTMGFHFVMRYPIQVMDDHDQYRKLWFLLVTWGSPPRTNGMTGIRRKNGTPVTTRSTRFY